ncbi:uncharacterized protein [Epargyreus clarus]|uniref:uncharacterized protein isoform X2 n=1 Tax=Epargyreus clarus TaxID=520877 RepID=UPI003C2E7C88
MEIEQSAIDLSFINDKSDEEIAKENEETIYKKKERNREYQRAWRQRQRDLKIKVSKEEKQEKKRKRHRENQRAYYQRIKAKMSTTDEQTQARKKKRAERARAYRQRKKQIAEQTVQTESDGSSSGSSYVIIRPECVMTCGEPCQEDAIPIQDNRSVMKAKAQEIELYVRPQTPETSINVKKTPLQVIYDPIPLVEPPKEMLEVTVPSMHTEAAVDVMIKEEPIDIHMETVGALRGTDACVKKETVHQECDVDVIPDSSLQVSVTVKQESVDEDEGERGADVCSGEYSNSGNSEHCYSRTHDTGPAKTRKSTKVSTTKVQDNRSQKKTNAQKCKEYREKQKLQNIRGQNTNRSDKCYEGDLLQVFKKPKTDRERSKAYYDRQKLKKPKLKKVPKTAAQRSKEYREKLKLKQNTEGKTHHLPM